MPSDFHNIYFQDKSKAGAYEISFNPRGQKVIKTNINQRPKQDNQREVQHYAYPDQCTSVCFKIPESYCN